MNTFKLCHYLVFLSFGIDSLYCSHSTIFHAPIFTLSQTFIKHRCIIFSRIPRRDVSFFSLLSLLFLSIQIVQQTILNCFLNSFTLPLVFFFLFLNRIPFVDFIFAFTLHNFFLAHSKILAIQEIDGSYSEQTIAYVAPHPFSTEKKKRKKFIKD